MSQYDFAIASLAVLLVGLSKAGFGGGAGMLATPILALVFPPKTALGVMLPLLILADWVSLCYYRRKIIWPHVFHLMPGAILGIAAAGSLLPGVPDLWLRRLLGGICLFFFLLLLARKWVPPFPLLHRHPWLRGGLFGFAGGLASTLAHAAGPIAAMYLIPLGLTPASYMAIHITSFTFINLAKLPFFLTQDLIQGETLKLSLLLIPAMLAGTALGLWANRHLSAEKFGAVVYALLGITGLYLVLA